MIAFYRSGKYSIAISIDINAPKSEALKVVGGFLYIEWVLGVKQAFAISKRVSCVGAGSYCVLEGFGEIDEYLTQWSEGRGFVYSVSPLGLLHKAHNRWLLEDNGGNACTLKMLLSYDLRFGLVGKVMHAMIMRRKLQESLPGIALALKVRIEGLNRN